jgi:hypothetical protein
MDGVATLLPIAPLGVSLDVPVARLLAVLPQLHLNLLAGSLPDPMDVVEKTMVVPLASGVLSEIVAVNMGKSALDDVWGHRLSVSSWCGASPGHCLPANGCQSGCTGATTSPPILVPVSTTTALVTTTSAEPVIGSPTTTGVNPNPTGVATTDGKCGLANQGKTCVGWDKGGCCSMYGFCGNTDAHCGDGCQSGPCKVGGSPDPPGPTVIPVTGGGAFAVIGQSGVPAMHAGLLPNGRVVFLDKVENYTQLKLPNGQFAYSSEYNPEDNTVVPLAYKVNKPPGDL